MVTAEQTNLSAPLSQRWPEPKLEDQPLRCFYCNASPLLWYLDFGLAKQGEQRDYRAKDDVAANICVSE
jgi:hypothetical protein